MKNILFLLCLVVSINACNSPVGNGFVNDSDLKFGIGSEETVKLFQSFDSAWKNLDYNLMKTMIADSISFEFQDGKVATNAQEFIDLVKKEVEKEKALNKVISMCEKLLANTVIENYRIEKI